MRKLNEMLARSPAEVELFNRLDGEADLWSGAMMSADETPSWIRFLAGAYTPPLFGSTCTFCGIRPVHDFSPVY